ncbi:MAG: hypothetical protein OJF50_003433 [Nitrospira sp.]|nr:hypothetical protein [Nitrospira sp.]
MELFKTRWHRIKELEEMGNRLVTFFSRPPARPEGSKEEMTVAGDLMD